ncbi:MAG: O-antigen ligase family protein [Bacteroidales bacterium]|jgi:hypothetical protein|nr:O-antigen ligase family protein [Bacteroidales bacterium]
MLIKQRNLLTNILFWVAMIFMAYFAENVVIFDLSNFQRAFSLLEYILLFAGIMIILGYYFYCEHKYNGLNVNWILMVILSIIVAGAAIGIFITPETQFFETIEIIDEVETTVIKTYTTSVVDKIKSFLFVLIAAIGVYIQIIILPRLISFKRYVLFLMYIIVTVSLVSAFVSYVLDFDSYVHLYQHGLHGYIHPQSFVFNRNMYALMLLLGMLALYAIISYLPKWYNYVFLIFIFINIFFTFSKAAFGIALISFVVHFIYRMIATFSKSKVRNIVFLVLGGIAIICGVLLIPFPFFMDVQLFSEARRFILEYYVELGIGSYDGRTEIWNSVVSLSSGIHLWFGRGLTIFNNTLFFYCGEIALPHRYALFSHNGFLEILGQWGLIGFIPYCLGVLSILGLDIYVAIKNYKIGIPALIIFGAFLGYTMVETSTLFDLTIEGITTTALVTLPALSWLYDRRRPQLNHEIIINAENLEYNLPHYDLGRFEKQTAKYVALLLGLITLVVFHVFYQQNEQVITYVMFIGVLIVTFLVLPRTLANIYILRSKKRGLFFWPLFFFVFLLGIGSLITYLFVPSPFILLLVTKVHLINLLVSEKFMRADLKSFKDYFIKSILTSLILFLSVLVSGLLIVFLIPNLTLFLLSEIIALYIVITIPFVREFKLGKSYLNKKFILMFARCINE